MFLLLARCLGSPPLRAIREFSKPFAPREDVSPCDHFGLGSLVDTAEKTCSCLGKLKGFLEQASEFDSEPSAKALTAASEMFACLVKNGFDVQTNKPVARRSFISFF